jgi:hypothetical protein
MAKITSLKQLILGDSILLYALFGIILSAIYGTILAPIIKIPIMSFCNANIDIKYFIATLEQKTVRDIIKWIIPFSTVCVSFLFLYFQHNLLEHILTNLAGSKKQGGILKLFFCKVLPWFGVVILSFITSIWMPFTLHAWAAVLLVSLIIFSIFLGVVVTLLFRMQSFKYTIFFIAFLVLIGFFATYTYVSL